MYIACRICDSPDVVPPPKDIDPAPRGSYCAKCMHVANVFEDLQKRLNKAELKTKRIQDAVFLVLSSVAKPLHDQETPISVDADKLRNLWDAAELVYWEADTVEKFSVGQLLQNMAISAAHKFFYKRNGRGYETLREKMEELYKALCKLREYHGWEEKFDLKPEDYD